jgi:hypothetical protein
MATVFYYILASLPFLHFGQDPPLSYEALVDRWGGWLNAGDQAQLRLARLAIDQVPWSAVVNRSLKAWVVFENSLRNELVRFRADRLKRPPETYLRPQLPWDSRPGRLLGEVVKEPSPLLREQALAELRWRCLTDLSGGHAYDLDALIIYALKLQILQRLSLFDEERGRQRLEELIEDNLTQ